MIKIIGKPGEFNYHAVNRVMRCENSYEYCSKTNNTFSRGCLFTELRFRVRFRVRFSSQDFFVGFFWRFFSGFFGVVSRGFSGFMLIFLLVLPMFLILTVWTGEGVQFSLYTHILKLLLPTIRDNVLSTLNKIVPSDKSCRSVKFNSRAPTAQELMACCKNRN